MKKRLLSLGLSFVLGTLSLNTIAQSSKGPVVHFSNSISKNVPTQYFQTPDLTQVHTEDAINDANGMKYRFSVLTTTYLTPENSGLWTTRSNGDRVWQLKINYPGAKALSFYFSRFILNDNATFDVLDVNGQLLHKTYSSKDVLDFGSQNMALCAGDEMILQLVEPVGTAASEILLDEIYYAYRNVNNFDTEKGFGDSDNCQVNVNCSPEGDDYQDEKRGVARILVVDGGSQGWCTGSLVNNLNQDCKPYFLTALHCGETASTANFTQWRFYFGYESPNCNNPASEGSLASNFITGCVKLAESNDGGGNSGSDYLLVQLGSLASEATTVSNLKSANFNAYWNGWDANNTTSSSGVGIHHPSGDIKKISTYSSNLISTQWGSASGSHWRVTWVSTTNGHGVTEGGSSGSPLFTYNGGSSRIVGTLTGGSSYCTATSSPDLYGKMSYHWASNAAGDDLSAYLDPNNTGIKVLDGSSDPCANPTVPVTDFIGTPTVCNVGNNVQFNDLTSGVPDTWAWTITPGSEGVDWTYVNSTSSTSQHPEVQFNTVGFYTISLTASNAQGTDTETKVDYIEVVVPTDPCDAASTQACATDDEYIYQVTLTDLGDNSTPIDNVSACSNYTDYTNLSATLVEGQDYEVLVTPNVVGGTAPAAYTNDEIAVWIDYNNDLDFDDPNELIGSYLIAGTLNTFSFTVPAGVTPGAVTMRVRISYNPDDGAISSCGETVWGEVEDYTVVLEGLFTSTINLTCEGNQTVNASSGGNQVPDVTDGSSASTDCPSGIVTLTQSPAAGTALVEGANVITVTATDECGSTETCTTTVTYVNDVVLNLSCGSNVTMNASTDGGLMPDVTGDASASSNCPTGSVTVTQSPAAGTTLSEGANVVTVTATDGCGNTETCQVTVTYNNDVVLSVNCDNGTTTLYASNGDNTMPDVTESASGSSNCPTGTISYTQSPAIGTPLTVGSTTVTITITDGCGNTETCTETVIYVNDVVLNLTCGSDVTVVASSDGTTMPNVTVDASASSNCPSGSVSITQSPAAGTSLSPGANVVTITATDGCNNTETCQVTVTYLDDLGLEDANVLNAVNIYPNPTQGSITVDLKDIAHDVTVELYDVTGKLIASDSNNGNPMVTFDLTNVAKGIYQVRLTSNNLQVTKRISKM